MQCVSSLCKLTAQTCIFVNKQLLLPMTICSVLQKHDFRTDFQTNFQCCLRVQPSRDIRSSDSSNPNPNRQVKGDKSSNEK